MLAEMEEELRCAFLTLPGHWHVHTALRAGDDHLVQSHSEILYLTVGVQVPVEQSPTAKQSVYPVAYAELLCCFQTVSPCLWYNVMAVRQYILIHIFTVFVRFLN